MNPFVLILVAGVASSLSMSAAVLQYSLTATGDNGTTGTGSFSFDDSVVLSDYSSPFAASDLLTFSVTLQVAGSAPSPTTFGLSDSGGFFVLSRTAGVIDDFNPGVANSDGYSISPMSPNTGILSGNDVATETITWSYAPVPEPATTAALAGLALGGFAVGRRMWRRR